MKRTFIAIKISTGDILKNSIVDIQNHLSSEKVTWVDTNNLHTTLAFLGDTNYENIDRVKRILSEVFVDKPKFPLNLVGLGVFKNIFNPRVLWIGIEENEPLTELYHKIAGHLAFLDYKADHNFSPHLTIGRIKFIADKQNLKLLLKHYNNYFFQSSMIEKVTYYESVLTPSGPIYKPLLQVLLS